MILKCIVQDVLINGSVYKLLSQFVDDCAPCVWAVAD